MALVPFRVSGAAASQQLEQQLLQVGPHSLLLQQRPRDSGNMEHLQQQHDSRGSQHCGDGEDEQAADNAAAAPAAPDLSRVGFVLWQSGYVLSDFLLRRLPALQPERCSSWAGVRVLELGTGAGTVGLFLALAGAQVVLTDQAHILPLTRHNLELNFPATAQPPSSSSFTNDCAGAAEVGSFGCRGAAAARQQQTASAATDAGTITAAKPLSAAAAFAAVFGSGAADTATPPEGPNTADGFQWQVFGRGPLVAEFNWGEPAEQLRSRVAAAALARIAPGIAGEAPSAQQTMQPCRLQPQPQQQRRQPTPHQQAGSDNGQAGCCSVPDALHCFDVVVGADVLYEPACHQDLLRSLREICSQHTQVFICYRVRGLGEAAFETAAAAAGWAVQAAPPTLLHEEFQGGDYRLLCLSRLGC